MDLRAADLRGVTLFAADLRDADLRGADLTGSDLRLADWTGADTDRAKFDPPPSPSSTYSDGEAISEAGPLESSPVTVKPGGRRPISIRRYRPRSSRAEIDQSPDDSPPYVDEVVYVPGAKEDVLRTTVFGRTRGGVLALERLLVAVSVFVAVVALMIVLTITIWMPTEGSGSEWGIRLVGALFIAPIVGLSTKFLCKALVDIPEALDGRRPILFLRSHIDDKLTVPIGSYKAYQYQFSSWGRMTGLPFEEVLQDACRRFGPLSALWLPGEPWKSFRFGRERVRPDRWQEEILPRIEQSSLIAVVLGSEQSLRDRHIGLAWEIASLIALDTPSKVVLVFPPVDREELLRRWRAFRDLLEQLGTPPLPEEPPSDVLLATFSPSWECSFTAHQGATASDYSTALLDIACDLCSMRGTPEFIPDRYRAYRVARACFSWSILGMLLSAALALDDLVLPASSVAAGLMTRLGSLCLVAAAVSGAILAAYNITKIVALLLLLCIIFILFNIFLMIHTLVK